MKLPHPIPYQGSKRNLAAQILEFFPSKFDRLIEPFAGSAAMTIASAFYSKCDRFIISDVNEPLIELWKKIINDPESISREYSEMWHSQEGKAEKHYYEIRDRFNDTRHPQYLLFLLAKCVKAAVRYNAQGNFNQSPDKRRLGRNPSLMKNDIMRASHLLKGKTEAYASDYRHILDMATTNDLVYMDPPYQGTGQNGGFNYAGNIDFHNFVISLYDLNKRDVPFILSYDGRTGEKTYGNPLPDDLNLTKIEINAGRSSQATLLNRKEITIEALYLSQALVDQIQLQLSRRQYQTELFTI